MKKNENFKKEGIFHSSEIPSSWNSTAAQNQ